MSTGGGELRISFDDETVVGSVGIECDGVLALVSPAGYLGGMGVVGEVEEGSILEGDGDEVSVLERWRLHGVWLFFQFLWEADDFSLFFVEGSPEDFAETAIEFYFLLTEDIDSCFLHTG